MNTFTIENLPFKSNFEIKLESQVIFLSEKDKVDSELAEFAKVTMDFWHYYQLETYHNQHRLVFKMDQEEFNKLVKNASVLAKKQETKNFDSIFQLIFSYFRNTLTAKDSFKWLIYNFHNQTYKINLINQHKSCLIQLFKKTTEYRKSLGYYINFAYNSFSYSFFFKPNMREQNINDGQYSFLQTIEFRVI